MELILIAGLPGSGKTTLAENMAKNMTSQGISNLLISDPMNATLLLAQLDKCKKYTYKNLIFESTYLCDKSERTNLLEYLKKQGLSFAQIKWICFKNEPDRCYLNTSARNDGRDVTETIRYMSKIYTYPDDASIIDVYTPDEPSPST